RATSPHHNRLGSPQLQACYSGARRGPQSAGGAARHEPVASATGFRRISLEPRSGRQQRQTVFTQRASPLPGLYSVLAANPVAHATGSCLPSLRDFGTLNTYPGLILFLFRYRGFRASTPGSSRGTPRGSALNLTPMGGTPPLRGAVSGFARRPFRGQWFAGL